MTQASNAGRTIDVSRLIEEQKVGWFAVVVIFTAWLIMLTDGYELGALAYAAPSLIKSWGIQRSALGPVFGANIFGIMVGSILFGWIGDKIGRKRAILFGAVFYGLVTLSTVWATTVHHLLWLRFVAGVGIGGAVPNAFVLVSEFAPKRLRATWVTTMFTGYTLGAGFGGGVAVWLVPKFGWTAVFVVGGLAPIIAACILSFVMHESLRYRVLNNWPQAGIRKTLKRLAPGLSVPADAKFIVSDERSVTRFKVSMLFQGNLRQITTTLWLAYIANSMALFFLQNWLPVLIEATGIDAHHAAMISTLFSVGGTVGSLVLMRFIDTKGVKLVTILPLIGFPLVAALGMGFSAGVLTVIVFGVGFCVSGTQSGLNAVGSMVYPTSFRAKGTGTAIGIAKIGSISGPMIGGALLASHMPVAQLFQFAAIPVAAVTALIFILGRAYRGSDDISEEVVAEAAH
ncbi:MFS transporter [Paraburkholderia monticola]|uniref:MFS transporter n=1 Tax=Paraburkholderia monticola TaxID=1399968 RepID=A0A149Q162_9BURK|nr:MFS transporter [Paraburkholderia monticola]KXU91071.1 MFS transporter [Paraburkholderia monticola]